MHPDEQIESLEIENKGGECPPQTPELEWVLPVSLAEAWSICDFASVFDSITPLPPGSQDINRNTCTDWRGLQRGKRLLLAVVHNDSTIVYYLVHDGIVKPRPN